MKLIRCYIENFGGLHQFTLDFEDGLTVLEEPNGFGKTTLAEFLRAMFYGFPRASKSLEKNPRKKYLPWQGGKYGGNLIFAQNGKVYKVERFFGAAPKQDTFVLYDQQTHQRSADFSEALGEELFQLDSDSFARSTYLPQNHEGMTLATDSIRSKLGNLVEDTGDVNNFEKAVAALRARRSAYLPFRGTGGSVAQAQEEISKLQEALEEGRAASVRLEAQQARLEDLRREQAVKAGALERIRQEITQAASAEARAAYGQQLRDLEQQQAGHRKELDRLRAAYAQGLPQPAELDQLDALFEQQLLLEQQVSWTEADRQARDLVNSDFPQGPPTAEQLRAWQALEQQRLQLEPQVQTAALPPREQLQLEQLQTYFASGLPRAGELSQQQAALGQLEGLRQENVRLTAAGTRQTVQNSQPARPAAVLPLLLLALASLVGGVVLLILDRMLPGVLCLVLGLVALIGAGYSSLSHRVSAREQTLPGLDPQIQARIQKNEDQARSLEQTLRQFTDRYCPDGRPISQLLPEIQSRQNRYEELLQQKTALEDRRTRLETQLTQLEQQLTRELTPFCGPIHPEDLSRLLPQLEERRRNFLRARDQLREKELRLARRDQALAQVQQQLRALQAPYGLSLRDRTEVLPLRQARDQWDALEQQLPEDRHRLQAFRQAHQADLAPASAPARDPDSLRQTEANLIQEGQQLSASILELEQEVRALRAAVDQLPQQQDALAHWKEVREADQQKSHLLDLTISMLETARDSLSTQYLGPIQLHFARYLRLLTQLEQDQVNLGPDLEISLERQGVSRELGYFSTGQADLVSLCMRLALVDALFGDTRPLVILDDPFVNLDDAHTEKALTLLQQLSQDHQLLYLTCNSSRIP